MLIACALPCPARADMAAVAAQVEEKAAAEASARAQEEQQREAERRAALRERAESYKAQEASRLQVKPLGFSLTKQIPVTTAG